ncbi:MAG: response regulator transcription factor [Candidatus Sericytochromatia bacterium]
MTQTILVIEDDPDLSLLLQLELKAEGYNVKMAQDGMQGLIDARQLQPDLIILDRSLPRMDGLEVCRRIRQTSSLPILMLTSFDQINQRVEGLDAGANDYLTKPFHIDELMARIRAQLRTHQDQPATRLRFADLDLDLLSREAHRSEQQINLSAKEFDLLAFFLRHPNQVLPKARIIEAVWEWDYNGEDNIVEVYVHNLRKKLQRSPRQPQLLHTVRGAGYILRENTP